MWKRHHTKPILFLLTIACGVLAYFGYSGPPGDRRFLLGCLLVCGAFLVAILVGARVLRCPRCGADMGRFESFPAFASWRTIRPRYVECRYCRCVVDRHDGNRPV